MAPRVNVLISGAGVAGPVLAYWLARQGMKPTIIERAPALRVAGQSLEVEGRSLEVVRKMGLEEKIVEKRTHEEGLYFVDKHNRPYAELPINDSITFTNNYEILRGDMVQIFYDASKPGQDTDQSAALERASLHGKFDVLVIADRMNSKTRGLVFNQLETPIHGLGLYCAFFFIPWSKSDGTWSRYYSTAGRQILLRPHGPTGTAAHLGVSSVEHFRDFAQLNENGKKEFLHQLFTDVGWEASRILQDMDHAEDFYMTEVAQVKVPKYHNGRVVLLGDAAFCPSPFAGVGASGATVAAYVLAAELPRHDNDAVEEAFEAYEAKIRPWMEMNQKLPPGMVPFVCPRSDFGVGLFRVVMRVLLSSLVLPLLAQLPKLWGHDGDVFKVPEYKGL